MFWRFGDLQLGADDDAVSTCGHLTQAELRCAHCGQLLHASDVDVEPGPGAEHAASSQQGAKTAPTSR